MLRGNIVLLRKLPEIHKCTAKRFCERCSISLNMWTRWTQDSADSQFNPRVEDFVTFCNRIKLSPSLLICSEFEPSRTFSAEEIWPAGREWKPVRFDRRFFLSHFDYHSPIGLPIKDMMQKLGKTYQTYLTGWKSVSGCTLRLRDLFLFCDTFHVDINKIIVDPNGNIAVEHPLDKSDATQLSRKLRERERRIRELNRELEHLRLVLSDERRARLLAEEKLMNLSDQEIYGNWSGFRVAEDDMV